MSRDDGLGGTRSIAYAYAGAKAHLGGRGFLGFRQVKATDLQTGIVASETKTFHGLTLSSTTNSHTATDLGGTRKQVALIQSQAASTDLNGVALPLSPAATNMTPMATPPRSR